jgi:hypothetical protein
MFGGTSGIQIQHHNCLSGQSSSRIWIGRQKLLAYRQLMLDHLAGEDSGTLCSVILQAAPECLQPPSR